MNWFLFTSYDTRKLVFSKVHQVLFLEVFGSVSGEREGMRRSGSKSLDKSFTDLIFWAMMADCLKWRRCFWVLNLFLDSLFKNWSRISGSMLKLASWVSLELSMFLKNGSGRSQKKSNRMPVKAHEQSMLSLLSSVPEYSSLSCRMPWLSASEAWKLICRINELS